MPVDRIPITPAGHTRLQDELKQLKSVERPNVVKAIEEARAHGDLSENAEYDAAKDRQGHIEARIRELEDKLSRVHVIDPTTLKGEKVVFGATVRVFDNATDDEVEYQIVGEEEADVTQGRLSVTSPVARALIGKRVGDEAIVRTPKGNRELEVVEIRFQ